MTISKPSAGGVSRPYSITGAVRTCSLAEEDVVVVGVARFESRNPTTTTTWAGHSL